MTDSLTHVGRQWKIKRNAARGHFEDGYLDYDTKFTSQTLYTPHKIVAK